MIIVHHLENSRSQRILWLLEELGVPYDIKRYARDRKTLLAPEALRTVHPLGKSPVITDGEVTVAESGAIIEYLLGRYGEYRLKPDPGTPEALRYTYWLHYAEGSLMPPLVMKLVFARIKKQPGPIPLRPVVHLICNKVLSTFVNPQVQLHLRYVEGELRKTSWFAGEDFTAADIQMSYPLEVAAGRASFDEHPRLVAWLQQIHSRPAYQRALQRGGPLTAFD
jgi:glutathione S-transferase